LDLSSTHHESTLRDLRSSECRSLVND
jgi:hypothetical protein